jgi:hypothetical protein
MMIPTAEDLRVQGKSMAEWTGVLERFIMSQFFLGCIWRIPSSTSQTCVLELKDSMRFLWLGHDIWSFHTGYRLNMTGEVGSS